MLIARRCTFQAGLCLPGAKAIRLPGAATRTVTAYTVAGKRSCHGTEKLWLFVLVPVPIGLFWSPWHTGPIA
jgi:hypothetical protein